MCISGMYDLTPVRLSARSRYVAFDDAAVAALSPLRHLDRLHAPLVVAYGTCETPEFQRQNRVFAATVEAGGKVVELLVGEHYDHFEFTRDPRQLIWSAWACGARPDRFGIGFATAGRSAPSFRHMLMLSRACPYFVEQLERRQRSHG
jgi:hypothetical protein